MDLGGLWRAEEADDERGRQLPDPALDDRHWAEVPVPGQWRLTEPFAASDGPLLYRRHFEGPPQAAGRRTWLTFDGLFYQADVWLDGAYLGDTEGYFAPHTFEVTDHTGDRREHLLALELACAPERERRHRRNLTGAFQGGEGIDPEWNPGGIWAGVHLDETGPVRIAALRVTCREATDERASLELVARLDAAVAGSADLTTTVGRPGAPPDAEVLSARTLATGVNHVRWRVTIERPALWWPRALGPQPLYEVTVAVRADGQPSDERAVTTGLRRVRMQQWVTTVNGERLFLKGAALGPTRRDLSAVTEADVAADLVLARDAGLDLLRVSDHVAAPALYDLADRTGMLLWQDFPSPGPAGPARRQAASQARQAVDLLGHHPSIVLWCAHDDAGPDRARAARSGPSRPAGTGIARRAARQSVPDVEEVLLDRSVRRAFERADGSRPVVARSGLLPHPVAATDTHVFPGWYDGEVELAGLLARWPRLGRFVGAFGAQAVPTTAAFAQPQRWPDLDWDLLERRYGMQRDLLERWSPVAAAPDFAAWRDATQAHQAQVIKRAVETLRRLKYRPTGGFCLSLLADPEPAVTTSVLGHDRAPKAGYAALQAACAPVLVAADPPAASYRPGATVRADLHVVSDLRTPLEGVEATAVLCWPGGRRTWRFEGAAPADGCARIGRLHAALPADCPPGELRLDLGLTWADAAGRPGAAANHYRSSVSWPAGARPRARRSRPRPGRATNESAQDRARW